MKELNDINIGDEVFYINRMQSAFEIQSFIVTRILIESSGIYCAGTNQYPIEIDRCSKTKQEAIAYEKLRLGEEYNMSIRQLDILRRKEDDNDNLQIQDIQ